jgi:hypothetical protein
LKGDVRSVGSIGRRTHVAVSTTDLDEAAGWVGRQAIRRDGLLADVAVVVLPAADTMPPAAQLGDYRDVTERRPNGPDWPDGFV